MREALFMYSLFGACHKLLLTASLLALMVFTSGAQAAWVDADHPHIQYLGRVSVANPKAPAFSWTGVSIRLRFTGPSV